MTVPGHVGQARWLDRIELQPGEKGADGGEGLRVVGFEAVHDERGNPRTPSFKG